MLPRLRRRAVALGIAYACLGLVSCDDPLSPDSEEVGRLEVNPTLLQVVVGDTRTITARVVAVNGNVLGDRRLYWSTQDPGVVTVSQTGLVTAVAAGNTQVAVSSGGKSTVVPVTVTPRPVTQVRIVPNTASVQVGRTTTLRADALDATANVVAGKTVLWASSATAVATVTSTGVVTGIAAGTATISGSVDGVVGTAVVTVTPIPVATVTVSPGSGSLVVGQTIQLSAATAATGGQTLTGRVVTWSSNANAVATVSSTGLVTAIAPGSATITATSEGINGTASITVTAVPVASIRVTPDAVTVAAGQTLQLAAQALDADGNVLNRPITWSSDLPARATVSATGLVTALSAGEVRISARSGNVTGISTVTVTQVPIARIDVTPTTASVLVGGTQQLTATPRDAGGNALPGRSITWLTGAPSVATVSQSGLVTGVSNGSAVVFAASEGQSGSAAITVSTVAVASVSVTPPSGNIQQGQTLQLTATARDAGNNILTGRTVTWTSTDETRATVSSQGRVVAITPGTVTIQATVDGVTGTGTYTITQVPVASITVAPPNATLAISQTVSLTPSLFDASSNPLAVTGRVILYSTNAPSVATVTAQGIVTGVAAGSATITVTCEGQTATVPITVSPVPVASVTLSPNTASLNQGSTQAITATARDASNNILTGRPVTWASSNVAVATVNTSATGGSNTITAVAAGSATITAVIGGVTGLATVTVTQVPIATITVTGATSVVEGGSITLTATARDAANNVLTGRTIVWSSNNAQVSVSQAGVVTAVINSAAQTATITASSPGGGVSGSTPSGTAPVSVSYAPVATVSSTTPASVSVGATVPLTATLANSGAQTLSATGRTLTWASLDPLVASVNSSGVVMGIASGVARIEVTASSPGQAAPFPKDTSQVTVSNVPVATVDVAPALGPNPGTVHVGATYARKFVAVPRDAGGIALTGRQVTWTVPNAIDQPKVQFTQNSLGDTVTVTALTVSAAVVTLRATSETATRDIQFPLDLVPVSSVTVTPNTATLNLFSAATQALAATPLDSAGATISGTALGGRGTTWTSSATSVATVNSSGLVTAVAAGSATITATVDGTGGTSSITVVPPVTAVAMSVSPDSLILPGNLPGTVTVTGAGSTPLSGRTVTLSVSPGGVFTVAPTSATSSGTGTVSFTVTGVAAGSATITASSEGINQTFVVKMLNPVASVTVAASPDSVIGTSATPVAATATLRDAASNTLTNRPTTWASSAPAVASVSTTGVITPLAVGSTNITATAEGVVGTKSFRVLAPVNAITLTTPGDSIFGTGTLQATPDMRDAANTQLFGRPITWSTTNAAAATVNSSGLITGVAAGTADITASVEGKSATVTIRVLAGITSLALTPATDSIIGMGTLLLTATSTPVLQGRALTVTSSNPAVATASPANGNTSAAGQVPITITYVAAGTTTLTVSAPAEGQSTTRVLRMLAPVASVTLTSVGDSIIGTRTLATTATLKDAANNTLTGRPTTWSSSNPAVATVNATTGVVTGVTAGTTNITATSEGVTSTALALRVLPEVAVVTVDFTPSTLLVTETVTASVTLKDASNNTLTGRPVTWSVSPSGKATVSAGGVVTAVDSGTANVIATVPFESKTGQKALTVNLIPAQQVTVSPGSPALQVGQTQLFTPTAFDSLARVLSGRAFTWSSSNGKLTINSSGVATAVDSGTVVVTASTSPGTPASPVSGTATVTITLVPVGTVTLAPNPGSVTVGGTTNITITAKTTANANAVSRACTITSGDITKFTVNVASGLTDANGQFVFTITGVASTGSTPVNVTATCEGVSGTSAITVP